MAATCEIPTTQKSEQLAGLSIEELQDRLQKAFVRVEKALKSEMAPLLYHLRKKLHEPGSRKGKGWAAWVEENLAISRRTCDRWSAEYAQQQGLPGFEKEEDSTSSRSARGRATADDQVQISANWIATRKEQQQFNEAWETLGNDAGRMTFEFVTGAAAAKKGVRHAKPKARRVAAAA